MNKRLHLYEWDHEPKQERESVFASTGFASSTLANPSGYHPAMELSHRSDRSVRFGLLWLILFTVLLLGAGAWALHRFAPLLRIV